MAIKKAYQEIVAYLEDNQGSKVKTILPGVIELASAKSGGGGGGGSTIRRNEAGEVTHIFCYYHKMWEPIAEVEFGKKATSPTGLNNMCKEGTSQWTKQQRVAKKAKEALLDDVAQGIVAPGDIVAKQADIDTARALIVLREDGIGEGTVKAAALDDPD